MNKSSKRNERSATVWIIVGSIGSSEGAYVGASLTRVDMIAQHVSAYAGMNGYPEEIGKFGHYRLTPAQSAAWELRKKCGDRAVRGTITWEAT